MKSTLFWTLVIVNVLLLISFIGRFGSPNQAVAQPARQAPPRPGDYLMIPGAITGASNGIVYVIDVTNGRLSAMTYNESRTRLEAMQSLDLNAIFERGAAAGGGAGNQPNPRGGNR
jgi:hypothetical protein